MNRWHHVSSFSCVIILHCTVLYCTVLYCTVLYCTVLYCTVLYCTVLYCTVLHSTLLFCAELYWTLLYWILLCCTVQHCLNYSDTRHKFLVSFNMKFMIFRNMTPLVSVDWCQHFWMGPVCLFVILFHADEQTSSHSAVTLCRKTQEAAVLLRIALKQWGVHTL